MIPKRNEIIALHSISEDAPQHSKERAHDGHLANSIALLTKQVSKLRNSFHKHFGSYGVQVLSICTLLITIEITVHTRFRRNIFRGIEL